MVAVLPPHWRKFGLTLLMHGQTFKLSMVRYGAAGVWVGTRFVASVEAGAPKIHKDLIVSAGYDDTLRTLVYTGRPLQVRKTDYIADWYVLLRFVD